MVYFALSTLDALPEKSDCELMNAVDSVLERSLRLSIQQAVASPSQLSIARDASQRNYFSIQ